MTCNCKTTMRERMDMPGVYQVEIDYCPAHNQAENMLSFLRGLKSDIYESDRDDGKREILCKRINNLIYDGTEYPEVR